MTFSNLSRLQVCAYLSCQSSHLTPGSWFQGTIALSASLADSLEALFNARIPKEWLKRSWEAATLGNWFLGLLQRHDQLNKWLANGRPRAFWLTGFFNPQVRFIWHSPLAQLQSKELLAFPPLFGFCKPQVSLSGYINIIMVVIISVISGTLRSPSCRARNRPFFPFSDVRP